MVGRNEPCAKYARILAAANIRGVSRGRRSGVVAAVRLAREQASKILSRRTWRTTAGHGAARFAPAVAPHEAPWPAVVLRVLRDKSLLADLQTNPLPPGTDFCGAFFVEEEPIRHFRRTVLMPAESRRNHVACATAADLPVAVWFRTDLALRLHRRGDTRQRSRGLASPARKPSTAVSRGPEVGVSWRVRVRWGADIRARGLFRITSGPLDWRRSPELCTKIGDLKSWGFSGAETRYIT